MSRHHDLDQILRKNLGAAYAESTGLVKKEKVNKYKAFAESVKARKVARIAGENAKLKSTINEVVKFSINSRKG